MKTTVAQILFCMVIVAGFGLERAPDEGEHQVAPARVELVRALTGLWGEFMHADHGCVRVLDDSRPAISQVLHGMDSQKCASYKRAHFYSEDAVDSGLIWLDFIPGESNPAGILTKHVACIGDFEAKNGVACGSSPHLYDSTAVRKFLDAAFRFRFRP